MKLVLIQFEEISSANLDWVSKEGIGLDKSTHAIAMGLLIDDQPNFVTVCLMLSPRCFSQSVTIPRGCIKRMWKLKTVKKEKSNGK